MTLRLEHSEEDEVPVMADDPYLWLETIDGAEALDWVERHNRPTLARLSGYRFEQMRVEALEVFDADTRIPMVARSGEYLYNFRRDAAIRGGLGDHAEPVNNAQAAFDSAVVYEFLLQTLFQ
jgi:prolyl oligopeptidase family protein